MSGRETAAECVARELACWWGRPPAGSLHPGADPIGRTDPPLGERLDILRSGHPTAWCRRHALALAAALAAIDRQAAEIAALKAEVAAIRGGDG